MYVCILFQYGQTVAHRAAILGCVMSVSVLVQSGADFDLKDNAGNSALELARMLCNRQCYDIASKMQPPLALPKTPLSVRGRLGVCVCVLSLIHI